MAIKDLNQNFWQLACVSGTAMGLPVMAIGGQLAQQYGSTTALISVFLGNFILWLVGLSIISMAQNRSHALQNIKEYLGGITGFAAAVVWISVFIIWYTLQIQATADAINSLFPGFSSSLTIGGLLGLLVSVIGIGGFKFIKQFSLISLPLLICLAIYIIFASEKPIAMNSQWAPSLSSIMSVILIWLGFGVNLPTFFRHSRSKQDSIIGLSLMTVSHVFFQAFTIFVGFNNFSQFSLIFKNSNSVMNGIVGLVFVLIAYVSVNLLNIYFASSAWEILIPKYRKTQNLFTIGAVGTIAYLFHESIYAFTYSIEFLEKMSVSFIATLAIVLLIDFLIKSIVKHRPRPLEKLWSSLCWAAGCFVSFFKQVQPDSNSIEAVMIGVITSMLGLLFIIFIEETVWSIKKIRTSKTN